MNKPEREIQVSFGYQCNEDNGLVPGIKIPRTSSFSCLSGAALGANYTLANTNMGNGLLGAEILPTWDSPKSFHRVPSSPNLPKLDILSSSLQSSMSNLSFGASSPSDSPDYDSYLMKSSMSAPSRSDSFLNAMEVQVAGGAAGEDRVQAVCSEENGWLFCAIYDGFNGRDAADFLAGTLYENIIYYFNLSNSESEHDLIERDNWGFNGSTRYSEGIKIPSKPHYNKGMSIGNSLKIVSPEHVETSFKQRVLDSLQRALNQAENEFLYMVEQEMEERPDLVSIGCCVLVVLLHGMDLYTLDLGDSRAVLATFGEDKVLKAVQLTEFHSVDNEAERAKLLHDHPDDPATVVNGKVKGKLKVTRAFGVGYLKKKNLNDALMGILRVRNLISPPYISVQPSLNVRRITESDRFVIVGSDGLFDFFTNEEAVKLVCSFILSNPSGDPAKFLLEQLVQKAAVSAGFSMEELMNVPVGRRRKYHDDVTVIVITLGTNQRTSKASTCM